MYFLGHMAWAYVFAILAWAFIPGIKRTGKLFIPLILILGVLPDADLLFGRLGIVHHTVTHSFFFWIVLFVPFFVVFRLKAIPYFVAVVQHFAFGDLLVDKVMLFWPFKSSFIGLNWGMGSPLDVAFESAGLVLMLGIMIYIGDLKRLFSIDKANRFMIFPFLALLPSLLLLGSSWSIDTSISYPLSKNLIVILAIEHVILLTFIGISAIQGMRAKNKVQTVQNDKSIPPASFGNS